MGRQPEITETRTLKWTRKTTPTFPEHALIVCSGYVRELAVFPVFPVLVRIIIINGEIYGFSLYFHSIQSLVPEIPELPEIRGASNHSPI